MAHKYDGTSGCHIRGLTSSQEKKRSFFVVVGDRQKDVIVNLYHILLNVDVKLNKSVVWAYKNKLLGFSRCEVEFVMVDAKG